jgi:hypothetical protein
MRMTNIYKIERVGYTDYEECYGAIVCADSVEQAQKIHPSGDNSCWGEYYDSWVEHPKLVKVTLIGTAIDGMVPGKVIMYDKRSA